MPREKCTKDDMDELVSLLRKELWPMKRYTKIRRRAAQQLLEECDESAANCPKGCSAKVS